MDSTLIFQVISKTILIEVQLKQLVAQFFAANESEVTLSSNTKITDDITVFHFTNSKNNCSLVAHEYSKDCTYSIDLHFCGCTPTESANIDMIFVRRMEENVKQFLQSIDQLKKVNEFFVPVKRGIKLWPYFCTTDERLVEVASVKTLFEKQSKFQLIRIVQDRLCGNILYLDDDVMFGESDQEAYTRVLLGLETGKPIRNDFVDKTVLILGGGDGGVIAELLKHSPKMVEMVEIDEDVIVACRQHMRTACGDALDTYQSANKHIIIGDCLEHLHRAIESGKQYDFIVNDLTEFPVNKDDYCWSYNFATENSQVMELSTRALKPVTGRYLSRGAGLSGVEYWQVYEADAARLGLSFKAFNSFVPSFYEIYRLYEMWKP